MEIYNKTIMHIKLMSKRFIPLWKLYGFSVAFGSLIFPLCHLIGFFKPYLAVIKHRAILNYLYQKYNNVLKKYSEYPLSISFIEPDSNIWVCWWDGYDSMPPLVKACYKSICENAGKHPVNLITKDNFNNYVSIPDFILDKLNRKIMTITHFSNILRANLLYDHGGIWMDATILTLNTISFDHLAFYTLKAPTKNASISGSSYAGLSDKSIKFSIKLHPRISRWSGFLLAGNKNSPVFAYMRDILYAYWTDHNDQIDYLLYDYTIALGYDNIPVMKTLIDNTPCSEVEKFILEKYLNTEYTKEKIANYSKTPFHKLTWKKTFHEYTKNGKLSIYGYLLGNQ